MRSVTQSIASCTYVDFFPFSTIDSLLLLYFTLELNYNMPRIFGITLHLLMPISWSTTSRSLQLYASAGSVTALNLVCSNIDIFRRPNRSLK
jgi:hypothetical protein